MFGKSASAGRGATTPADGERKRVTVLFTDIVGSTALAEKLDPEEWGEIVSGAHAVVAEAIQKYDGRIAQLLGDGALAFFGAPTQHEDDPERAIFAGIEILRGVAEYARQLKAAGRVPEFRMRVGLNTGLVVVGNIGAGQHVEYLAVGDTVNLAARMQSAAEPDTICVAENTAREVRHAFELQSLGALEVKGKSELVPAYRVVRAKATIESKRGIVGLDSPIVGRDREIAQLRERIDRLMRGRGGIVSLIGEAGLGKSRLASEILLRAPEDFDRLEGRSLSFEMTRPFAPFIEIFNRMFDVRPGEPPAQAYARIKDPYLATLMGVKPTGEDLSRVRFLDPPLLRERIMAAAIDTLARRAATKPLLILLEDLHWADSASLDLVERLMAVTGEEALLLALVFRPGANEPSWPLHLAAERDHADRYTPIVLEPLTEGQARALVANLLEIEDLPESVRALILARAEGNPFFAEEIIRSLLDGGLVVRDGDHWRATREIASIALPDTLAGVISARLDRLDESSKRAAQTASVIGREFQSDVLKEISDIGEAIDPALDKLEERELVHAKPALPGTYLFKHALTRDAAYSTLLLSRRRTLHKRAGECLERMDPELADEIGRQYVAAQDPGRALPHLLKAASRAARSYSTPEAVKLYRQALEIARNVEDSEAARRAFEGLGGALTLALDVPGAMAVYADMERYATDHDDAPMRVSALNKAAYVSSMLMGDFPRAMGNLLESETLARSCGDKPGLTEHIITRCTLMMAAGDFDNTVKYMNEVVDIGRDLKLGEQMAFGLTHVANALTYMTRFEEAWDKAQEARVLTESIGDKLHLSEVLGNPIAFYHLRNGDLDQAMSNARAGYEMAAAIGALYPEAIGALMFAWMARARGEYDAALTSIDVALAAGRRSGLAFFDAMAYAFKSGVMLDMGQAYLPDASALSAAALKPMETPMGGMAAGMAAWPLGEIALASGRPDTARALFERGIATPTPHMNLQRPLNLAGVAEARLQMGDIPGALETIREAGALAEKSGMRHLRPFIDHGLGGILAASHDDAGALDAFGRADAEATAMGLRPVAMRARTCAADALLRMGRKSDSDVMRAAADAMALEIAPFIADPAQRASFLDTNLHMTRQTDA